MAMHGVSGPAGEKQWKKGDCLQPPCGHGVCGRHWRVTALRGAHPLSPRRGARNSSRPPLSPLEDPP
eukprot:5768818-Prymnesium_polylepis.3